MVNQYLELKNKHQKEVNEFPMGFAFNDNQFKEAMLKLGLQPDDTKKVVSIGGGGFIKKTDVQAFNEMMERQEYEMNAAREDDTFVYQMFVYELDNHEYSYTHDTESTLYALGLTYEAVEKNERLKTGLKKAIKSIRNRQEI